MRLFSKLCVIIIISIAFIVPLHSEDAREEVEVLNIEVPVRVMHRGKPVDNLEKGDFRLYENGKRIGINGFTRIKRKIRETKGDDAGQGSPARERRMFVLAFSVTDFNRQYEKGVRYFFEHIVRNRDAMIVMINNVMLTFNDLKDRSLVAEKIISTLRKEGNRARANVLGIFRSVELGLRLLKSELEFQGKERTPIVESTNHNKHILFFLRTYKSAWDDYRSRFLHIDMKPFINLSEFLKKSEGEKWAVSFYQLEKFPMLDPLSEIHQKIVNGAGNLGKKIIRDVQREFKAEKKFPAEAVGRLFTSGGVRFDLVMVPSRVETNSDGILSGDVSTSIENTLRQMSDATGGRALFTADIGDAFRDISEREDIVYMLTYAPRNPKKKGRLKVRVKNKKYKVVYDSNSRAGFISRMIKKEKGESLKLSMENIHFRKRVLHFTVRGFKKAEGKGRLKLNLVFLSARDGSVQYSRDLSYNPLTFTVPVKLDLSGLKKSEFDVMIELSDLHSGRTAFEYFRLKPVRFGYKVMGKPDQGLVEAVPETVPEDDKLNRALLAEILDGTAGYCRNLKNSAFHFFCRETVRAEASSMAQVHTRFYRKRLYSRKYLLDYQLINTREGIREQRKVISGRKNMRRDFNSLIMSFLSERPVFAPVMILGEEGQKKFRFTLEKIWEENGRRMVRIRAVPLKRGDFFFTSARLDLDTLDYSVNRIRVHPRYIKGYEQLMTEAFNLRSKLYLDCEVRFDIRYRGLRFPSFIRIEERYRGGPLITRISGTAGFVKSKTEFTYDNYRFFNIDMSIKEK